MNVGVSKIAATAWSKLMGPDRKMGQPLHPPPPPPSDTNTNARYEAANLVVFQLSLSDGQYAHSRLEFYFTPAVPHTPRV